jgi:hypothetical protein
MNDFSKDDGVITVLLERFQNIRLPRALDIKARVDKGEKLHENDLAFLGRVLEDAQQIQPLLDRHPEYEELVTRAMHLYNDITKKALENEQKG